MDAPLKFFPQHPVYGAGSGDAVQTIELRALHNHPKMGAAPFAPPAMAPMLLTFVNDFQN